LTVRFERFAKPFRKNRRKGVCVYGVGSFSPSQQVSISVELLSTRAAAVRSLPGLAPESAVDHASQSDFAALLKRPVVTLLVFLAATLAAYAPALGGSFLWDDNALVKSNLLIRSPLFCLEVFRHTLFDGNSNFYRPVQTLTFIADYWFWGMNAFGYHLTSILVHGCNAWLLFLVLRRVLPWLLAPARLRSDVIAFAVALVWTLHPVHSAAIAYISGRADSLAMGFCLLAWLFCEQVFSSAGRTRQIGFGICALICLLAGLCSKEIASIWLALFAMYLFGVRRDLTRPLRWTVAAAGLLALAVYAGLRSLPPAPPAPPPYPPLPSRWLLMIRALGDYGSLMLFPSRLFMERQVFAAPGLASPEDESVYFALGIAGVLMLVAFLAGAWLPGRGRTLRRFGAGWFLLAFLPISNLFLLNASVAEHWLYLPSIGFLLFLAGAAVEIPLNGRRQAVALGAAVLLIAGALGLRTYRRSFDWLDELTFFRQTIQDGGDVPRARLGLANSYSHLQNDAAAIPVLRRIAVEYPKVISARINLANALARQGQLAEAKTILEHAAGDSLLDSDPRQVIATVTSLDKLDAPPDWPQRRSALLARAVRRNPNTWELVQLQLKDCEREHDSSKALALASHYADAHWWHAPARYMTGCARLALGQSREALADFARAAQLDVHDVEALNDAAEICLSEKRFGEARDLQARAVRRQPDSPKQHVLLAEALEQNGDKAGAAAQIAVADRLLRQASVPIPR
jgi:tetratricopeptide (TPR) repeat protein